MHFKQMGRILTKNECKLFKSCGFLVGISLDGIWKTHNCYRHAKNGKETFDRILETCKMLKQYDVPFNILTVVHDQTAQYLNEIYSFYSKKDLIINSTYHASIHCSRKKEKCIIR